MNLKSREETPFRTGTPFKIGIDARLPDGPASGARAVVVGLARALSQLTDASEEYHFLVTRYSHDWLTPYVEGKCFILEDSSPAPSMTRSILKRIPGMRRMLQHARGAMSTRVVGLPTSDGVIERAGIEVMHFLQPFGFITKVPTIYQIHDLQHQHLPQFFSREVTEERDRTYRALAERASRIVVMTQWGREDVIQAYGLPAEKIVVVPWAPVTNDYSPGAADLNAVSARYCLPEEFAFYPAHTWVHKNHLEILNALAWLRDERGLKVPLVCSGRTDDFFPEIMRRVAQLRLEDQVRFVGYVSAADLKCLYRLSRLLVYPSLFEGWGLPLMEAALEGVPIACSSISPLREQVGQAAVLFDPLQSKDIADAVQTLWCDAGKREHLVMQGLKRVEAFSWDRTARLLRAHYRILGNRPLSGEDKSILSEPPLV